jgi:hypothetical protein
MPALLVVCVSWLNSELPEVAEIAAKQLLTQWLENSL